MDDLNNWKRARDPRSDNRQKELAARRESDNKRKMHVVAGRRRRSRIALSGASCACVINNRAAPIEVTNYQPVALCRIIIIIII